MKELFDLMRITKMATQKNTSKSSDKKSSGKKTAGIPRPNSTRKGKG